MVLLRLEEEINSVELEEDGFTRPGMYIYELLGEANINHEHADYIIELIEQAIALLTESKLAGKFFFARSNFTRWCCSYAEQLSQQFQRNSKKIIYFQPCR